MSAVPVGYEAFHSLRRKLVTLICFLLTAGMITGVSVYVDSYSVHEWDRLTDVGPVAMIVQSDGYIPSDLSENILQIQGVEKAVLLDSTWGDIKHAYSSESSYWGGGRIVAPTEEFFEAFPSIYEIFAGRLPQNTSEVAVDLWIADAYGLGVGEVANITTESLYGVESALFTVVGVYTSPFSTSSDDYWEFYYNDFGIAIVVPGSVYCDYQNTRIHVDVDRTPITPFDAGASLNYLYGIENSIRQLDPSWTPEYQYSRYWITGLLSQNVYQFITWQQATRNAQIYRSVGVILLAVLVMFLAIRHNLNERRYESNMLLSRGASQGAIDGIAHREFAILAFIASIGGLVLGILFSRVGLGSEGFLQFNVERALSEPLLITIDSLVYSIVLSFIIPILTILGYRLVYSTKKPLDERKGKMAKVAKVLQLIKWDATLLVLTVLLMVGIIAGGASIHRLPFISQTLYIAPLALFLSMASLSIKGLKRGANRISQALTRLVGVVPASVGIRRIGKSASSAGPVVIVLVLAMSMAWGYAVIGSSLPVTKENHAKFALGGDVVFQMESYQAEHWDSFTENVSQHAQTQAFTILSVLSMSLSSSYDRFDVVAMQPQEYIDVGYDYAANSLNDTQLGEMLLELKTNPLGAIITRTISEMYEVSTGDTLRAVLDTGSEQIVFAFTIIGVQDALTEFRYLDSGTDAPPYWGASTQIGDRGIWVNQEYLAEELNLTEISQTVCCVRTTPGANGTAYAEEILESGGNIVVAADNWGAVTKELDYYTTSAMYTMDRAVDNMLMAVMVATVFGAFTVYAAEGAVARKREIALLRSMGAEGTLVVKAQSAEMLVLLAVSSLLLVGYGPVSFAITLFTYPTTYYVFPISVFPVIPWMTLLAVVSLFLLSVFVFIIVISAITSKVNIATALNAAWAESGPYGGDV